VFPPLDELLKPGISLYMNLVGSTEMKVVLISKFKHSKNGSRCYTGFDR